MTLDDFVVAYFMTKSAPPRQSPEALTSLNQIFELATILSLEFVQSCIVLARQRAQSTAIFPTDTLLGDDASSASSYEVSKAEAVFYYAGISPTPPKLVYRTGADKTPWVKPTGQEAYRKLKQARGVFGHKLNDIWNDVGPKVRDLLIALSIPWTSIDVVRFVTDGDGDKKIRSPVVIWVGVVPDSLNSDGAFESSNSILNLLAINDINDVEVEYRESVYTPSVGAALLPSVSNLNTTVDVRGPLTPALGLFIATSERPDAQGTMGLYFAEGGSSDKVLGLTCHHVLFKTDDNTNPYVFSGADAPRKNVQLLSLSRFERLLEDIKLRIGRHGIMVPIYEEQITKLKAAADEARDGLEETERMLQKTHKAIEDLERFYDQVKREWGPPRQRVIGHISSSPALAFNVGPEGFTEDWGAFELDGSRFKDAFKGNFIDLGTEIPPDQFTVNMYPRDDGPPTFKYPSDRLLELRDMITEERMRNPDMLDHDKETCLFVIKNGNATGVTIGRATGIFSFVRADLSGQGSKEWAIYNYDNKSGVFSARGDSGSIIVDGLGRIGGLLTGGAGKAERNLLHPHVLALAPRQAALPQRSLLPHHHGLAA
ncbi:hypothetical protein HYPSUDRAFT_203275 [Hypholoma sublateritium FD-334 SS-4]|uniref:Uncharacterized protein n=1 Tax=Hypholoma sublateritium (strain FD-334 SS-4) TaxID=945553 RepID=A0A0D2L2W2_HYPSF|nr:hypothetical protein HYPSUDRAFT_203275 [Hypholoma sublateritium FD-334 SS-4]